MCNIKTGVALLLVIISEVVSTGKFKLELTDFTNEKGLLNDRSCCVGPASGNVCTSQCRTYFKICLKPYQKDVTAGDCAFGEFLTEVLGNNSLTFPRHVGSFSNPLIFDVQYSWPGDFSLIIDAFHEAPSLQGQLIASFRGSSMLVPPDGWSDQQWNSSNIESPQSVKFRYKIACDPSFYGDSCSKTCTPRDDALGHYECDADGEKVCRQGWQGEYCDKAICLDGCSREHGECSKPNECSCRIGWQGRFCNECVTYPDCENGYCQTAWQCTCYEGWGGLYCNQDLNYCTNNRPCRNGGTCTNTGEGSYTCTCSMGFTGTNCEVEIDNCMVDTCLNGGVCKDIGNDFLCQCPQGYAGSRCEVSAARCEQNPCANGGQCEPVGSSYRCHCVGGWTGVNCQQEIDECMNVEQPCQNGGRCVDGLSSYVCVCPAGFSGQFCEFNKDECEGHNPCQNGGQCVDGNNRYRCRCRPGYMGDLCETDIDDCLTRPCANGGSCRDKVNDFQCYCAPGYYGRMCTEEVNECNPVPCQNGGTCEDLVNGYECHCPLEYEGTLCEYKVGEAPSTTPRPRISSTTTTSVPDVGPRTGQVKDQNVDSDSGDVELTQQELILIVCLASGIPMCLLFILVTILLCRRCRRQVEDNKNLEARQNEINGMNNRIHNPVVMNATKGKADLYEYPTTEKKVINETEAPVPVHQIPLDFKNSAATQLTTDKVADKNLIKNIANISHSAVASTARQPTALTAAEQQQQQYIPYYHQGGHSNIPNSTSPEQTASWSSSHSTNNSNNIDNSSNISTVCDTVLHTTSQQMSDSADSSNHGYRSRTTLQPTSRHSHNEHSLQPSHHQERFTTPLPQVTDTSDYHLRLSQNNSTSDTHCGASNV